MENFDENVEVSALEDFADDADVITIHNVETGEVVIREMTEEESEQLATDRAEAAAVAEAEAERKAARAALLDKLGITAEEAALILG